MFDVDGGANEKRKDKETKGPYPYSDGDLDPCGEVIDDLTKGRGDKAWNDESHAFFEPYRDKKQGTRDQQDGFAIAGAMVGKERCREDIEYDRCPDDRDEGFVSF